MVALNVTSLGYAGSIDEISGAKYFNLVGQSRYGVESVSHLQCQVTTGDRMIRVLPGVAWAHNIVDTIHTAATIQLDAVSSGSRWDLVVLRRNTDTKATSLEVIKGSSQKAIPSLPSSSHPDQPLALCRVQAGQSTVQSIVDLRVWANNTGATAQDDMVLGYFTWPGATVEINGTQWVRRITSGGASEWAAVGTEVSFHELEDALVGITAIGGYSVTKMPGGKRRVDLAVDFRRTGSDFSYLTGGGWKNIARIGNAGRGNTVGGVATIQTNSPKFYPNTRNLLPQEGEIAFRVYPTTGEILFDLPEPDRYIANTWPWRKDETSGIHLSYFVN